MLVDGILFYFEWNASIFVEIALFGFIFQRNFSDGPEIMMAQYTDNYIADELVCIHTRERKHFWVAQHVPEDATNSYLIRKRTIISAKWYKLKRLTCNKLSAASPIIIFYNTFYTRMLFDYIK